MREAVLAAPQPTGIGAPAFMQDARARLRQAQGQERQSAIRNGRPSTASSVTSVRMPSTPRYAASTVNMPSSVSARQTSRPLTHINKQYSPVARLKQGLNQARRTQTSARGVLQQVRAMTPTQDQALRVMLDRTFAAQVVTIPLGTLTALGLLHMRLIASHKAFLKTIFGKIRYTATTFAEMRPDARTMRPFTFTPRAAAVTALVADGILATAMLISFAISVLPYILVTLGIGVLLDPGLRALMFTLAGRAFQQLVSVF